MEKIKFQPTLRLALLGNTGTGKDTCVNIIQKLYPLLGIHVIRLALPLYQAQHAIYTICGKEKKFFAQDGVLLNFLGQHMRTIHPNVIQDSFQRELRLSPQVDMIICPDVRPLDLPFIKEEGFFVLHITTDPQLTTDRRKKRGDLFLGSASHPTEIGTFPEVDAHISNNGTMDEFEQKIAALLESWVEVWG